MSDSGLYEEAVKAGLPVLSTRTDASVHSIQLRKGATKEEQDAASALAASYVPPAPKAPGSVVDALVVLSFEPGNATALGLLRAHYKLIAAQEMP